MKVFTTFKRLIPTTVEGEVIKVITYYSSLDKVEIDKLQEDLKNTIGAGVVEEFIPNDMNVISQKHINTTQKAMRNDQL